MDVQQEVHQVVKIDIASMYLRIFLAFDIASLKFYKSCSYKIKEEEAICVLFKYYGSKLVGDPSL